VKLAALLGVIGEPRPREAWKPVHEAADRVNPYRSAVCSIWNVM